MDDVARKLGVSKGALYLLRWQGRTVRGNLPVATLGVQRDPVLHLQRE